MRHLFIALSCVSLFACSPNKEAAAPEAADAKGWTQGSTAGEVALDIREDASAPGFRLACAKAGSTLVLSAALSQVGMANMAPPFALVASGATFPATLVAGTDAGPMFSVTLPLTPDVLAAVRDATTARISVNEGYAFAESDVDAGKGFEKFAAACSTLTGVVATQR